MPDAACSSKAHQLLHKRLAQCCSDKQSGALLETDVDAVHVPLMLVSLRWSAPAEHDLPMLHAAAGSQAIQGMRGELGDELAVWASNLKCRVRFKPGDESVARMLSTPVLVLTNCSVTARTWDRRLRERHVADFSVLQTTGIRCVLAKKTWEKK